MPRHRYPAAREYLLAAVAGAALVAIAACAHDQPPHPQASAGKAHHTPTGFRNNYTQILPGGFWKWQWERWRSGKPEIPPGGWHFPLRQPDLAFLAGNRTEPTVTWIGHATALLQLDGLNILTDPQFSARASPFSFAGPKRWVPPAIPLADLPHVDIVLISHNHYDHLDDASIRALARQRGGAPRFVVPLGLASWFAQRGIEVAHELDWWESARVQRTTVHLVPVQHWSARTPWDRNHTLWGGYVIESDGLRVFFAGDTGYSQDFRDIAARFGSFDLALLPIGAYEPRWFMRRQHIDPEEAVQIHRDLQARHSMAIHWGTFALTDEPLDEPPRRLAQALDAAGLARSLFWVFEHGETRTIPRRPAAD